jgi:hypothetical protein
MHPGLMGRAILVPVLLMTAASPFLGPRSRLMLLRYRQYSWCALIRKQAYYQQIEPLLSYIQAQVVATAKTESAQLNAQKEGFRKVLTMMCKDAE